MYIDIVDLCGLIFLIFCIGYLYHRYGAEREPDRNQNHKPNRLLKAINKWLKRHSS